MTTRKEKQTAGHRPRGRNRHWLSLFIAARDTLMALTFDGYTLRLRPFWLPSYASLDCLPPPCHSFFLSYVSRLLSSSSLSTLSPVSSLFLFFLSFSSFSFPLTSPKVLHVRVYVRSLFFFLLFFWRVRRRSSTDWNRIVKAAQLSE